MPQVPPTTLKLFWTGGEVPRWAAICSVAVVWLCAVAVGKFQSLAASDRLGATRRVERQRSLELVAVALGADAASDSTPTQRLLKEFGLRFDGSWVHVVGADGTRLARWEATTSGTAEAADGLLLRAEIVEPGDTSASDAPRGKRFVEALTRASGPLRLPVFGWPVCLAGGAGSLACLLIYGALCRGFRTMARISDNLLTRGDEIRSELHTLRLVHTQGLLATQWNRLVDLVEELSDSAKRSSAAVELKQVLEKNRRGELADVLGVMPDGLLYVVERGVLAYSNTMAQRVMGLPKDASDRVALTELQVNPTGQAIVGIVRQAVNSEGVFGAASELVKAEDGDTTYRIRVLPYQKRHHRGECLVAITDISQQVRSDRAAEEFVSQVTHELRTPLTNIRAYTETLSSGVFDDPKVITECYNVITKETRRLSRLVEDILSMSQLEVGTIQVRIDDVDLRALLTDSVKDLRGLADEKRMDMQLTLPSKLPLIRGDRDKLAVVMNNLLGNALKYTPESGSIQMSCQVLASEVLISVKDSGIGIDPADQERIFEKFQRGSGSEVDGITGTGIGLTSAREIARRHGGDVTVMSVRGQGSTFVVHLPLPDSAAAVRT